MTSATRSTVSRFIGGLIAACTAITVFAGARASADSADITEAAPLELDICYADNPLGDGYRMHVVTKNNSSRNAWFTVTELGNPRGTTLHDQTQRPGELAHFTHDIPLDKWREYVYSVQINGNDGGYADSRQVTNYFIPDYTSHCFGQNA